MFKDLLKKLSEEDAKIVQEAFDSAVKEQVKVELATIVESTLSELCESTIQGIQDVIFEAADTATIKTIAAVNKEVQKISESVSPYIDSMIAETLPEQLMEKVSLGLKFEKQLSKINEALMEDAYMLAAEAITEEVETLKAQIAEKEEKFNELYGKMIQEQSKTKISNKSKILESCLAELPDRDAKIVKKIFESTVDISKVNEDVISEKVENIYETLQKNKKAAPQQLKENSESRGVTVVESNAFEHFDAEVDEFSGIMEKFAITKR